MQDIGMDYYIWSEFNTVLMIYYACVMTFDDG